MTEKAIYRRKIAPRLRCTLNDDITVDFISVYNWKELDMAMEVFMAFLSMDENDEALSLQDSDQLLLY